MGFRPRAITTHAVIGTAALSAEPGEASSRRDVRRKERQADALFNAPDQPFDSLRT